MRASCLRFGARPHIPSDAPDPWPKYSPTAGANSPPQVRVSYADAADLIAMTVGAITDCIRAGFKRQHIAVISYRGREHSKLAPYDKLGPYALRAPTGRYDLLGNPVYTEGEVLVDSVHSVDPNAGILDDLAPSCDFAFE